MWQAFEFAPNCPFPGGSRHESNAANGIRDARSRRLASVDGVGDDFCLNARIVLDVVQIGGVRRSFEVLDRCYRAARIGVFASERTDARSVKVRKPRFVSSTSARFSSSVIRRAAAKARPARNDRRIPTARGVRTASASSSRAVRVCDRRARAWRPPRRRLREPDIGYALHPLVIAVHDRVRPLAPG